MKKTILVLCLFMVSCGLDRWEALPTDQDISDSGEVAASEETESDVSGLSETSGQSDQSGTANEEGTGGATMGTYPSTGTALVSSMEETTEEVPQDFDWARVLITEVVTDPQQDWSDTASGNGILFDAVPGTGTVGTTDEYVEIFNGTSGTLDISQWSLEMIDGTDETQLLGDAELDVYFSLDGNPQAFGAGEFVVIGNPAGSLNNTITVDLLNELSEIADEVVVDDANAESLDDEAFTRLPDGTWVMGMATPGEFE